MGRGTLFTLSALYFLAMATLAGADSRVEAPGSFIVKNLPWGTRLEFSDPITLLGDEGYYLRLQNGPIPLFEPGTPFLRELNDDLPYCEIQGNSAADENSIPVSKLDLSNVTVGMFREEPTEEAKELRLRVSSPEKIAIKFFRCHAAEKNNVEALTVRDLQAVFGKDASGHDRLAVKLPAFQEY